jgi:hypothetical protein
MKVYFQGPAGALTAPLRRCAQEALGAPIVDLNESPPSGWKEAIANADLVIVDITIGNASGHYVAGVAEALGKRVVLLSPLHESIPPLFEDRAVIVHHWNFEFLGTKLKKITPARIEEVASAINDDSPAGRFQKLFGDLLRAHGYVHRGPVEFEGSTFTVREQDMELALVQAIANRAKTLNLRVRLL